MTDYTTGAWIEDDSCCCRVLEDLQANTPSHTYFNCREVQGPWFNLKGMYSWLNIKDWCCSCLAEYPPMWGGGSCSVSQGNSMLWLPRHQEALCTTCKWDLTCMYWQSKWSCEPIKEYSIDEDCIFSMDETCCVLDKNTSKTWHISSAKQVHQLALHNEVHNTATLIPIISASGNVFRPTIIFKGEVLRGHTGWSNPLDARYGCVFMDDQQ